MANDYGVRENLRNAGFNDNDIGYNQDNGYVTVKGQNFLKPELNMNGTTYTNQSNFNNALGQYRTNERAANTQKYTDQYMNNVQQPQANPYVDQYTQMIGQIRDIMNRPQQDVYSTPQYSAALAANNQATQRANRQTQEAYGQSGFGRSTNVGDRIQRNSNDAEAYLQTQVVPQIQQQLAAQRQQEISNQMSLLDPVMALLNRQDTNQRYSNQDLLNVINLLDSQTQQEYANRQAEKSSNLDAALRVGEQTGRVLDPKSDWANLFNQTDAPLNYTAQRANAGDQQWQQNFDRGILESDRNYDRGVLESDRNYGLSQANASRSAESQRVNQLMDIWRNTGVAPEGIPGVAPGTRLADANSSQIANLKEEKQGLVEALRSGSITPAAAFKQIQEDRGFGFYTEQEAAELQSVVQSFSKNTPQPANTTETLTKEQQDAMPSANQLDKLYKEQGKPINAPELDWKSWYKDPLGRVAGVDFSTWQKLYGPQLKAK